MSGLFTITVNHVYALVFIVFGLVPALMPNQNDYYTIMNQIIAGFWAMAFGLAAGAMFL